MFFNLCTWIGHPKIHVAARSTASFIGQVMKCQMRVRRHWWWNQISMQWKIGTGAAQQQSHLQAMSPWLTHKIQDLGPMANEWKWMNMIYVYLHVSLFNNRPSPATHLSKSVFVNLAPLRNPGIHASEEFLRMVWRVWLSVGGGDPMVRHCRSRSLRWIMRNPSDIPMVPPPAVSYTWATSLRVMWYPAYL